MSTKCFIRSCIVPNFGINYFLIEKNHDKTFDIREKSLYLQQVYI
nr:MAG TPA: hypothetical protein [Caudoviricetes sp.]